MSKLKKATLTEQLTEYGSAIPAFKADWQHCNQCDYCFALRPNGLIDMKDFIDHKNACKWQWSNDSLHESERSEK